MKIRKTLFLGKKDQLISGTTNHSTISHHQDTGSPAARQNDNIQMTHYRNTKSPAPRQDDDVQMSNTIDIYYPKTWEQLEGQDGSSATQVATVSRDQLPLWFIRMVECINITERDVQGLFQALQQEGVTMQADISQMKALY
jgi:hypothetical protein